MKLRHISAVVALTVLLPFAASALTTDELQQQIQSLLAQITQLQQQLKLLPPVNPTQIACTMEAKICPDGTAVGRTGPNCEFAACPPRTGGPDPLPGNACPVFMRTLVQGATGDDVTELQQYLGVSPTGYFGPITAKAVVATQAEAGLDQVGIVGPQTRAWIYKRCGGGGWNQNFSASPTSGPTPLAVTFTAGNMNSTGEYSIDFGDGTSGSVWAISQVMCIRAPCVQPPSSMGHTYTSNGTYVAKLIYQPSFYCPPGAMCPQMMPAPKTVGTVTIYVGGGSSTGAPSISGIDGPAALNVGQTGTWTVRASVPNSGNTNLRYSVIWGDEGVIGQLNAFAGNVPPAIQAAGSFTHAYGNAGTYKPTFTVSNSAGSAQASASVVVGKDLTPLHCPQYSAPLCRADETLVGGGYGSDGCQLAPRCVAKTTTPPSFSASPISGGTPLNVNFSYPYNSSTQNGQYTVNFGDGTSGQMSAMLTMSACAMGTDCARSGSWIANHTYATAGTYTAKLSYVPRPTEANCYGVDCWVRGHVTITVTGSGASCGDRGCTYWIDPSTYPNTTAPTQIGGTSIVTPSSDSSGRYWCGAGPVSILQSTPCSMAQRTSL